MTPFERGINALLDLEERMCVRMHNAYKDAERTTAYDSAINTRLCINVFAKAYLADDDAYKKFDTAIKDMHKTVSMRAFSTNLDQFTGDTGAGEGADDGSH